MAITRWWRRAKKPERRGGEWREIWKMISSLQRVLCVVQVLQTDWLWPVETYDEILNQKVIINFLPEIGVLVWLPCTGRSAESLPYILDIQNCEPAVLPFARLYKLALHYSRAADPSHPGTCFSGLSVARALSAGPCATSPRDGRWLVSAASDVAAATVLSAGPPGPRSLALFSSLALLHCCTPALLFSLIFDVLEFP